MTKADQPSDLSEAAMALDHEMRRFEELAAQAARIRLNTEKNVERATDALSRAAESQDRINAIVQRLVKAVGASRQKQEADAKALMARAHEIAERRKQFAEVMQRMAGLGQMAKEVQDLLKAPSPDLDEVQRRMQRVADDAADIGKSAQDHEMEDLARQADVLRQQVLAAKNKVSLLAKKG